MFDTTEEEMIRAAVGGQMANDFYWHWDADVQPEIEHNN